MADGKCLRFIEVRSRTSPAIVKPVDTVDKLKRKHIISAARSFVNKRRIDADVRFDIVSVVFSHKGCELEYFPDAYNLIDDFL